MAAEPADTLHPVKLSAVLPPSMPQPALASCDPRGTPWRRLFEATLGRRAAELQAGPTAGRGLRTSLHGKHLGLMTTPPWAARAEGLREAAAGLGLRLSQLRADDHALSNLEPIDRLRLLARLYDAVACDGLPAARVATLRHHAGVPVLEGWCADDHPSRVLADLACLQDALGRPLRGLVLGMRSDPCDDATASGAGEALRAASQALGLRCEPLGSHETATAVDAVLDRREGGAWMLGRPGAPALPAVHAAARRWAWQACLLEALA